MFEFMYQIVRFADFFSQEKPLMDFFSTLKFTFDKDGSSVKISVNDNELTTVQFDSKVNFDCSPLDYENTMNGLLVKVCSINSGEYVPKYALLETIEENTNKSATVQLDDVEDNSENIYKIPTNRSWNVLKRSWKQRRSNSNSLIQKELKLRESLTEDPASYRRLYEGK